jgi:hypothetical protein
MSGRHDPPAGEGRRGVMSGDSFHVELFRIRDDGSIERRRFPPPFAELSEAVAAGEHYVDGTEFWFEIVDEDGNPAPVGARPPGAA